MDFAHLMETFTNPDTIHSLHIYDKMIVSGFSMFIGISVTLVTLTIVYIAMKTLTVTCTAILAIDNNGGLTKSMFAKNKKGGDANANNANNANANANANNNGGGGDADDDHIAVISAAIHAYYQPQLQGGSRIVIRNIRRGEAKTRYSNR